MWKSNLQSYFSIPTTTLLTSVESVRLDESIKSFWKLETTPISPEDQTSEELFMENF